MYLCNWFIEYWMRFCIYIKFPFAFVWTAVLWYVTVCSSLTYDCLMVIILNSTYALSENSRVPLLQHLFKFIVGGGATGDLQLPLYPTFAPISIVGLRTVVLGHNFNELTRQRRVLCLSYPQIGG